MTEPTERNGAPPASSRADDEAAFRSLFEATYRPLVAYARRRTADPGEADDIVSEVYATAWRRRGERVADAPALPWLYGIAGNVARNHWRSAGRRLRLVDKLEAEPTPVVSGDPAEDPGADLRAALGELPFDDQEILRLAAWEGLSHAEIGQVLECSANAVGIRLHRARKRLRQQLEAPHDGGPSTPAHRDDTHHPSDGEDR